jgi:hypothetical protein
MRSDERVLELKERIIDFHGRVEDIHLYNQNPIPPKDKTTGQRKDPRPRVPPFEEIERLTEKLKRRDIEREKEERR